MTLLLVRHAIALRRKEWAQPDHLRPLTPRGLRQAEGLIDLFADFGVDRILSSPSRRCIETVEPLAAHLGLPLEEVPQLAEGAGASAVVLLDDLTGTVVLCTHGDVLPELFDAIAPKAAPDDGAFPCEKGSTWVLDDDRLRARYLRPPE